MLPSIYATTGSGRSERAEAGIEPDIDPDLGEAQDELPINFEGDSLDIGFNASYLLEILRNLPTDELKLTFKAPERAATVEPVGWNDPAKYMCLIMPLRLVD